MVDATIKKARRTAIIVGTSLSLTFIAFVYAFVKQGEAKRQIEIAVKFERIAKECESKSFELSRELEIKAHQAQVEYNRAQAALNEVIEMKGKVSLNKK
jgi:phosphopantetheinyl transferase